MGPELWFLDCCSSSCGRGWSECFLTVIFTTNHPSSYYKNVSADTIQQFQAVGSEEWLQNGQSYQNTGRLVREHGFGELWGVAGKYCSHGHTVKADTDCGEVLLWRTEKALRGQRRSIRLWRQWRCLVQCLGSFHNVRKGKSYPRKKIIKIIVFFILAAIYRECGTGWNCDGLEVRRNSGFLSGNEGGDRPFQEGNHKNAEKSRVIPY